MVCAVCGAASLAKLTNGLVRDEGDGEPMQSEAAVAYAREILAGVKLPDNQLGTRPAHIRRYLKSLLKQRKDLVLVGRYLLIRPVRHLIRGAYFEASHNNRYSFQLMRYLSSLLDPHEPGGFDVSIHDFAWHVWQPHFQPSLMDTLAEEIFPRVGSVTTLEDYAAECREDMRVHALLLAGERDRAADYIRKLEQDEPDRKKWARTQWELLGRDIETVCAEAHAAEKKWAERRKLTDVWEPSPFPAELPAAERTRRSAEPQFATKPWIARPAWLLQDMPDRPGEVRFAKHYFWRDGTPLLLVPLSRDEAEVRHAGGEEYVLATRLPDGILAVLRRWGIDRFDPFQPPASARLRVDISVDLYGSEHSAHAWFGQVDDTDVLRKAHRRATSRHRSANLVLRCGF